MRRSSSITLVLITLFVVSLVSPYDLATDTSLADPSVSELGLLSDGGTAYTGTGSALDVSFLGTFVNASAYSDTSSTLSNLLTPGVSYSVENATTVTWTANVLVSPPAEVAELNFSVSYPVTDWKAVSVTDPLGIERTTPAEWYIDYDAVIVRTSAVDTYGVWTLTFTAANHIDDLEMGPSGGPYTSLTTTFDTGDTMRFGVTSSWITGASAEFDLIDPTGSIWYSSSDSTVGATTHLLSSFRYRKDITIHNGWVTGDFTDFPVLIDILDTDLHDDVQADADDIVFVSNSIILAHEIELFNQAYNPTQAHLVAWVKANLSSSTDTIISMYYGNPVVGPQSDSENVWSSSYSAVWHLGEDATDEGTSTDHLDSTSGDYYGDQVGNEDVTGIFGTGQSFDGTDDRINVTAARGLEPVGDVTFSGWFKLDTAVTSTPGPTQVILTKAIGADDDMHIAIAGSDYLHSSIPNGSLVFKTENAAAGQRYVWSLRTTWAADTWYYFTCTMYSATPTLNTVFVNGANNTNSSLGTVPYANVTFTDDWVIGGGFMDQMNPKEDNGWFEGTIDELRISNTIRSSQWINTEYLMWQSSSSFRTIASASTQTSPDMYIDKALDLTAPSGLWTVLAHYNDSGSSVSHRVGEYQRNFIVRRASTLSIESPSDAASGLESLTVGDILYLVVDFSDVNNADPAIGATVSMNWTVSGVGTTEYFEDLGDGRYSIARNTSELSDRMRWRIEIDSTHPYYSDASDSFDLDIFHTTQLTYESVSTTPTGFDFTATLVYKDTWDNSLISGATITFDDGSPVTFVPWTNGRYNITIATGALSKGDHTYTFNATNSANLYDMASVDVTFTLRNHYTSVTVSGNLETPYGDLTPLTIVITDLDSGTTLSASDVSSFSFSSSYGTPGESTPSDLLYDLDTSSWSVATESVTLSVVMTGNYDNPSNYLFDIQIRNRLTSITVTGNLETPYGDLTTLTIVITDLDSGTLLSASDVSSFSFSSSYGSPGEATPSDLLYDLDTSTWSVGGETVTLSVVMTGNYDNPTNYVFNIQIRNRLTSITVTGNLETPYGDLTTLTIVITDLDSGTLLSASDVSSFSFSSSYAPQGDPSPADLLFDLDTSSWSVGGESVTLSVVMLGNYQNPTNYVFNIQIRNRLTSITVTGNLETPFGDPTTLTIVITDLDSGTLLSASDVSSFSFSSSYGSPGEATPSDLLYDLDTSSWSVGGETVTLSVVMTGNYDNPTNYVFNIQIRNRLTSITVTGNLETPYGDLTTLTIVITDLDSGTLLSASDVSSFSFSSSYAPQGESTPADLAYDLDTSTWAVAGETVTLSVVMLGNYQNPTNYVFNIQIRNRLTSITVTGNLEPPYGNVTSLTIVITDLDSGTLLSASDVSSFSFSSSYGSPGEATPSDLLYDLDTSSWLVGGETVTLSVVMTGNYDNPTNYVFSVTISTLDTTLYNAPSNLLFTQGSDFTVDVHFNVSEAGPYYGGPINGEADQFVVSPYLADVIELGNGMYRITIAWGNFSGQGTDFTIDIDVTPSGIEYASASLVVSFQYREIISDLTANLYTVSTPYQMDVTIHLYFTDRDSGTGITTATISANSSINSQSHVADGDYLVELDVSSFGIGSHYVNLSASAVDYEDKWLIIKIVVTQIHTDAEPTTIRLEIPSGNSEIFYIEWTDLDNGVSLEAVTENHNWTGNVAPTFTYLTGEGRYQITFTIDNLDTLGTYLVWFSFSIDGNYTDGYCEIQVEIRSHDTILTSDSPPPTAFNALINITMYYYDFDNKIGIHDLVNIQEYVFEDASPIASDLIVVGSGYYIVQIDASTVGLGLHNFTVYINWTGAIQQYENKFVYVSVNVVGVDSQMTLITASDPSAYLETMTYTFLYSEKDSGAGITNDSDSGYGTGNVHISVSFDAAFNPSMLTISEVGGGIYQIDIDTTGFGQIGQFSMTITIDWDPVDPFYSTRDDTVSVWVLSRDTLLLVNPPSPVSFGEDATFTFRWEDTALSIDIQESGEMDIAMNVTFGYVHNSGIFTVTIDTTQFGDMGTYVMTLNLTWAGEPFYANRTSQISITVLARQTTLDYPTPDPTFYSDNVTIIITWTDVTNGASDGILGAIIVVSDESGVIPNNEYDVRAFAGGVYEIEFSTSRFTATGLWEITIQVSRPETYILTKSTTRKLDVRQRSTILSYEAIGKVAYGEPIEYILYFNDLYTSTIIGNGSGDVTLEILTTGSWVFASTWNAVDERYDVVITSYPESSIGVQIDIHFNMTFANNAPFYAPDDVTATFELRERLSLLSLEIAPNPAPFLDDATFRVQFMDVDADFGISADYIWVYYGMTQLNIGSEYTYTPLGGGNYELSVNSTTLGGIGQWAISVEAYWTSGAPYHNNASAAVNIRVTTRDTIVDITVPPSQTSFLDDVTFTFEYTDLYRGTAITSILTTDITLYNNGTLVNSGDFSLISSGSGFILTVDSEILGSTLGRYNLTIIVDWNELTSPYYVDAQTTTWVTVTTRTLSFALDPLDETRYGDLLNITFTLTDMSIGSTVDGADISFASQTLTLVEGVDYNIIPSGAGVYIIRVDTVALGSPGEFLFDLDISWDSGTSPYYRSMNTIELTGVISDIETVLIPLSDQVTVLWKVSAPISVDYQNMLWMNFTSGATVTWTWPGVAVGTLTETGFDGTYTAGIDTSLSGAGTYLITVEAWKNNFEVARAYITIVVQSLPSVIEPIDPLVGSIAIPRGSGVNITVYFKDTLNTLPIPSIYVVSATATFEGFVYSFYYSGTPGQWIVEIPANEPTIQPQGAYSLLIQASFDNFEPSSYILNIELLASRTEIILTGDTLEDMVVTYSQNAVLTVNLTKPDFGGVSFADGDLRWIIDEKGWTGNFTNNGDGTFSVVIDTIELGFGIWPVRIQANIWATASEFTDSSTSLTLTIKRIQTDVIRPTELDVAWGWTGNLTFIYNGTFGPIEDAYVEFTGEILVGNLYELSNGVYLVEVDTTLANPGIFTVTLTFQKENYQEAPVGVQFLVRAAQTEIYVDSISYTPTYDEVLEDMYNLEIPIGDSVSITFFYNDTDTGNDFVGGLSGAISTDLTNLYNMYYMDIPLNVTVIDLGNGLYRVVFDTTDVEIGAIVSSEPYRMYIEMSLANRTNSEILFRITVIDIPTQLTILDDQDRWIFINGESLTIELLYIDTWHDSGIAGAYFSANSSINAPFEVATEEGPTPGQYFVTISASGIKFTPGIGSITIEIGNGTYTIGGKTLIIEISQNGTDVLAMNSIIYGLPLGIVILIIGFAYVRVWSVPKRLRQINSQIKTIRKGKIPKPVTEAKSRQDLVADLFNDTYSQVAIVRTPEQMPLESIPVDVPELGELLIQLAILTNLDQQELDEFKADIAKMKISEQAAFVKEVIVQEAIRAGRREHKTVEQILEEVEAQASKRIAGEGDAVAVEDGVEPVEVEPDVETVILPDTDEATVPDTEVPSETVADEDPTIPSDRLSPFEIEELKKDLEAKGVPLHEIDTILKQAQELPRNLVEELIRSLEREK